VTISDSANDAYFDDQLSRSLPEFWRRMNGRPDFAGQRVLDFGCGHGAMTVSLAQAGAEVTAVDIDPDWIAYARTRVGAQFPELGDRVRFECADIGDLAGTFDAAVSKDTFEHVENLDAVLAQLHRLLRPGGLLYVGFSPLYYSPNGPHGRLGFRLPWVHSFLPERWVLARASRHHKRAVRSLADLGLNGWTPAQFRAAFDRSPFTVVEMRYNPGGPAQRVLNWLRRVPGLERFCTVGMYGLLRA